MKEFTDILTHGRRLQGAVKDLTIDELVAVVDKLQNIIERQKLKAEEAIKLAEEKRQIAEKIKQQMEAAGIDVADLQLITESTTKKSTGKKRPIKYRLTDENGEVCNWTGIGRMPVVFKTALENGKSLEDFAV